MQTVHGTKSLWVDVDNTLVFSQVEFNYPMSEEYVTINGRRFWVHSPHVEIIKDFKARGHTVVVWSAGGSEWAEAVVKSLDLENFVDLAISKPDWFIDDKSASAFMNEGKRFFKSLKESSSTNYIISTKEVE